MSFKKFSYIFVSIIFIFILFNLIIWNFYTKKLLVSEKGIVTGDLARIGYHEDIAFKRQIVDTLPLLHFMSNEYNYQKIDMLTLGDSFSNGGGKGLNSYYQDFIATNLNLKILNLTNYEKKTRSDIETVYLLGNSGFLEKSGIKYIIIESVVKKIVQRFSKNEKKSLKDTLENIASFYHFNKSNQKNRDRTRNGYLPPISFINNGNIKFLAYNFLYNFSEKGFISKVHRVKTDKNYFTTGNNDLLFNKNSIRSIRNNTLINLKLMNNNFNELSDYLTDRGIKLIFMPVVNKYDLYSDYIVDNKNPKDKFFDIFESLEKRYMYINTKEIFTKKLLEGQKDIFYIDDTHWTDIASQIVVEDLRKQLKLIKMNHQ